MKFIQILTVIILALIVACGAQPEEGAAASSLDVLPEKLLYSP